MNNNTITEICILNSRSDQLVQITSIIWQIFGLLSVIFGIPGHVLQIILLSSNKTCRKEPTSLYYIAIAICEIVFLLGIFWLWCSNMSLIKTDPREIFSCGIFYSIIYGSTTLSNVYLASMSIDRSVMVLYPARYRLIVTRSRVTIRILVICVIIMIVAIPHHFYFTYAPKTTLFFCSFHSWVNKRQIRIWSFVRVVLFVLIPSIITCISSFILFHNRCKHQRIHKTSSPTSRLMFRHSILVFFVSLVILFSLLPTCILGVFTVYDDLVRSDNYCLTRWKVYRILLNCSLILAVINYSMKFYIHLIISTSFRERFIQFITRKSPKETSRANSENKNEQHLLPSATQNKTEPVEI